MAPRHLIIGVDPGSTIGVAAVNLNGNFVHAAHSLGGGLEEAISIVEKWGTPSMIAVDVRPAPSFAVRMAASFNVPLYVPERPWREEQKSALLHHLRATVANAHERDALSAAVMAFRANQNTLGQVASEKTLTAEQREKLKHLLLQGIRQTIAKEMLLQKDEPAPMPKKAIPAAQQHADASLYREKLISLERANSELRKTVSYLEAEIEGANARLKSAESGARSRLMRDFIISKLQYEASRLKREIEWMRNAKKRKSEKKKQESPAAQPSEHAALKTLNEKEADLERIIRDYRKGRAGD